MMRNIMSGKLFLAPLDEKTLRRAMDIGTGTGIWSIDFGKIDSQHNVLLD